MEVLFMRIKTTKSKNSTSFCIIKDYTKNGKRTTKVVDKIGNLNKIKQLAQSQGTTVDEWLNNYLNEYIENHTNKK